MVAIPRFLVNLQSNNCHHTIVPTESASSTQNDPSTHRSPSTPQPHEAGAIALWTLLPWTLPGSCAGESLLSCVHSHHFQIATLLHCGPPFLPCPVVSVTPTPPPVTRPPPTDRRLLALSGSYNRAAGETECMCAFTHLCAGSLQCTARCSHC